MSAAVPVSPAHALLSASGADRWIHCPPSARLEEQFPDSTSEYAAEGSLAHEMAELKLRKQFTEPMGERKYKNALKKLQEKPLYQEEMLRYTDAYKDFISETVHSFGVPPYIAIEKKIDFSAYVPEGFGTADCIIIGGETMHVIDFKYGKGVPVSAEKNSQMMLYALGAYLAYSFLYPISQIAMTIVQPRLDSTSTYSLSDSELLAWAEQEIKPAAQQAFAGQGEYASGEWCRFCRAKALCRARADFNMSLEEYSLMKPPLISNEEVGSILKRAQDLAKWAKDLEEYALSECLAGNDVPGWKAVAGRSLRSFADIDAVIETVKASGIDEAMLYSRSPITLTAMETLLGKSRFNELLSNQIIKPPGKPALAPAEDRREAITNRPSAEEDFKDIGGTENGK